MVITNKERPETSYGNVQKPRTNMTDPHVYDEEEAQRLAAIYTASSTVDRREWLMEHLDLEPGESVLSVGCGPGYEPEAIAERVGPTGRVYGIDNSKDVLAIGTNHCDAYAQVALEHGDADAIPIDDERFDVAVGAYVYEYVPNIESAIDELFRVLEPGGRAAVISGDWDTAVWHSSDPERMDYMLDTWKTFFADPNRGSNLRAAFNRSPFEIDSVESYVYLETDLNDYAGRLIDLVRGHLEAEGIDQSKIREWEQDLREIEAVGETLFSFTSFLYLIRKPD